MLASDLCQDGNDCEMEGSGVMAILGFVFWIATAAVIPCMRERPTRSGNPPPPATAAAADPEAAAAESLTNTVEQTVVEEDGSVVKILTKTTTDINGNQTVTETRQVIQPASAVVATATLQDVDIPVTSVQAITD